MELQPVKYDELIFSGKLRDDRVNVSVKFFDSDWMLYTVNTRFNTKDSGWIAVKFSYFGSNFSNMYIKKSDCTRGCYEFDSKLFEEYLSKYFKEFVASLDSHRAFYPGEITVNLFNQVVEQGKDVSQNDIAAASYENWDWDIPQTDMYVEF